MVYPLWFFSQNVTLNDVNLNKQNSSIQYTFEFESVKVNF